MNKLYFAIALLQFASLGFADTVFVVNSHKDLPAVNLGDGTALTEEGKVTLRSALQEANIQPGHQVIALGGAIGTSIEVRDTLKIEDDLTLKRTTSELVDLRSYGETPFRFFEVMENVEFNLQSILVQRGTADTLIRAEFGAGMYIHRGAKVLWYGGRLSGCAAEQAGGAIYIDRASLELRGFSMLSVAREGGGIYNNFGSLVISSMISGTAIAQEDGGLLYNNGGNVVIGGTVTGGEAVGFGGALYSNGGHINVSHALFSSGSAESGGGIYLTGGAEMRMERTSLQSYEASGSGAGFYIDSGSLTASQSTFGAGEAGEFGGGGYVGENGNVTLINCTITDNVATAGGGLYIADGASVALGNTIVAANHATVIDSVDIGGEPEDLGSNLVGVAPEHWNGVFFGTPANPLDPKLQFFRRYPDVLFNRTVNSYVPDADSPAIDAGDNTLLAHPAFVGSRCLAPGDHPRIRNGIVDIGAIEVQEGAAAPPCGGHSADRADAGRIGLEDLLRVIQFFNSPGYHCDPDSEDGYAPGVDAEAQDCVPHSSDYRPHDWAIQLTELLRLVQFFNTGAYHPCTRGEDGFCVGSGK